MDRRRPSDVCAGQDGNVSTFLEAGVESSSALIIGVLERDDRESKSGGEWLLKIGDMVYLAS